MKVGLVCDEDYPVLCVSGCVSDLIEVPDNLWKDFVEAERHYHELHKQLLDCYNKHHAVLKQND